MRRVLAGLAAPAGPGPGLDFAVNFRLTLGAQTDLPNAVVSYGGGAGRIVWPSPQTAPNGSSLTCGFAVIGNMNQQDLPGAGDRRLDGNNYSYGGGGVSAFDFSDFPATGPYMIYLAQGAHDRGAGDDYGYKFYSLTNDPSALNPALDHQANSKPGDGWTDAAGDFYTSSAWLATNAGAGGGTGIGFNVVATDEVWRFEFRNANFTRLAHINITG